MPPLKNARQSRRRHHRHLLLAPRRHQAALMGQAPGGSCPVAGQHATGGNTEEMATLTASLPVEWRESHSVPGGEGQRDTRCGVSL